MKQRRRWFNGSLFASLYVLKHMWRICQRKKTSIWRNIAFMILYIYMIVQMCLSFTLVGSFYGVFSIFLRAMFDLSFWNEFTGPANIIEAIYIAFLALILFLSTTIDITWAENTFRLWSLFMGLFTLLMVINSAIYVADASLTSLGVLFLFAYVMSYSIPFIINVTHLRVWDFIKGVIYCIYLSPTYINLITIYAISNIHDVSWGSRKTTENPAFNAVERKRSILYRNYRAIFLIFWASVNAIVGLVLQYLYSSQDLAVIFYIAAFLIGVMIFRILLAVLHRIKAQWNKCQVSWTIRKRTSTVFDNVGNKPELEDSDVFTVYYTDDQNDMIIKPSNKDIGYSQKNLDYLIITP